MLNSKQNKPHLPHVVLAVGLSMITAMATAENPNQPAANVGQKPPISAAKG